MPRFILLTLTFLAFLRIENYPNHTRLTENPDGSMGHDNEFSYTTQTPYQNDHLGTPRFYYDNHQPPGISARRSDTQHLRAQICITPTLENTTRTLSNQPMQRISTRITKRGTREPLRPASQATNPALRNTLYQGRTQRTTPQPGGTLTDTTLHHPNKPHTITFWFRFSLGAKAFIPAMKESV